MSRLDFGRSRKRGLPPGSPVYVGTRKAERTTISVTDYDAETCTERAVETAEACREYLDRPTATWVNVVGLNEVARLLLARFGGSSVNPSDEDSRAET